IRLPWEENAAESLIAAGRVPSSAIQDAGEAAWHDRLLLWATSPGRRSRRRELDVLKGRADELATAIELGVLIRAQPNFAAATLEACNQFASRHAVDRVALGWWREPYAKIVALSQHNRVEPGMT